jgi:hypothetical protein
MTALKLRLVGRSDQPPFNWQTTNAEAKRVSEFPENCASILISAQCRRAALGSEAEIQTETLPQSTG